MSPEILFRKYVDECRCKGLIFDDLPIDNTYSKESCELSSLRIAFRSFLGTYIKVVRPTLEDIARRSAVFLSEETLALYGSNQPVATWVHTLTHLHGCFAAGNLSNAVPTEEIYVSLYFHSADSFDRRLKEEDGLD